MSNFSVTFSTSGSNQILALNGELDAHTAPEFEAAIQQCIDNKNHALVVDGANLEYISSAGLGVFMAYIEEIREHEGDIKIAALRDRVYNVFDLLGFPVLFEIFGTVDEAVVAFKKA